MGQAWKLLLKANNKRSFGDCDRLLRQVTNFNEYDPAQNKRRPISDTEVVKDTAPDGSKASPAPTRGPMDDAPPSVSLEQMMKNGDYKALVAKVKDSMGGDDGSNMSATEVLNRVYKLAAEYRKGKNGEDCEEDVTMPELRYWIALYLSKTNKKMGCSMSYLMSELESGSRGSDYVISQYVFRGDSATTA